MTEKLYSIIDTETNKMVAVVDNEEMLQHMVELCLENTIEFCIKKYELVDSW